MIAHFSEKCICSVADYPATLNLFGGKKKKTLQTQLSTDVFAKSGNNLPFLHFIQMHFGFISISDWSLELQCGRQKIKGSPKMSMSGSLETLNLLSFITKEH